jgi:diguanylate cyclase (GGDEF)-like protein/PAS domain S-box-containing protein
MTNLYEKIKALVQESIVTKSTLKILISVLIISLIASLISIISLQNHQQAQLEHSIQQLASTVENTASIAAFTRDKQLAKQVAVGLLTNEIVERVMITTTDLTNNNEILSIVPNNNAHSDKNKPFEKALFSPFTPSEQVGKLTIWLAQSQVKQQATAYAKFITLVMLSILLCITVILSWLIYQSVTKPIKAISDEIHSVKLYGDSFIRTPIHNQHDEIGRLVSDTNQLIARLKNLINSEQKLRIQHEHAEQRIRMVFEKSQTGMFMMNAALDFTSWNPALLNMLNYHNLNLRPQENTIAIMDILPNHQATFQQLFTEAQQRKETVNLLIHIENKDKKQNWLELSMFALENNQVQGVFNDITSHKLAELKAINIAEQDPLTGLLNRRGFEPKFELLMQYEHTIPSLVLLLIDLDGFKQINDQYGHHAGDYVLQAVSRILVECVRKDDLVARIGGDEFVVVLGALNSTSKAIQIAQSIIDEVAKPILYQNQNLQIGASIGIVIADANNNNTASLMQHADEAMYAAKLAGKSCYHLYNS